MAEVPSATSGTDPNYPTHAHQYVGFVSLLRWSMLVVGIVAAIVIYVIAN